MKQSKIAKAKAPKQGPKPISIPSAKRALNYELALTNPFDPRAVGARVPDMYSFPTEAGQVHTTFTINTDASGRCSAVVLPCLEGTVIGINTDIQGGDRTPFVYGTSSNAYTSIPETNINRNNAISLKTFSNRYSATRIVGVGYRIKPLVSYTNAAGKMIVASTPATFNTNPVVTRWGAGSSDANYEIEGGSTTPISLNSNTQSLQLLASAMGVPVDFGGEGHIDPSILSLPVSREISLTELVEQRGLECAAKVTSPHAFEFMNTDPNYKPGYSMTAAVSGYTSTMPNRVNFDLCDSRGFSQLIIRGMGLPVSTAVAEVEVIFHLESVPWLPTAAQGLQTFTGGSAQPLVDIPAWHSALQKASNSPFFQFLHSALETTTAGRIGLRAVRALGLLPG